MKNVQQITKTSISVAEKIAVLVLICASTTLGTALFVGLLFTPISTIKKPVDNVLNFKLSLNKNSIIIDQSKQFTEVEINEEGFENFLFSEGSPKLKQKSYFYYIPVGQELKTFKINNLAQREVGLNSSLSENSKPEPCCDAQEVMVVFPLKFDKSIYNKGVFPKNILEIISKREVGGAQIIQVVFSPIQYDGDKKLIITDSVDFSFILQDNENIEIDVKKINYLPKVENKKDLNNDIAMRGSNKSGIEYYDETTPVEYLIITNDELKPTYEPFARWKKQKGLNTKIVTLNEVYTYVDALGLSPRDDAEKLKMYLKYYYENESLQWVLFGGDEEILPLRYCYHYDVNEMPAFDDMQICDIYFTDMTGEWDVDSDGVWGEWSHDTPDISVEIFVGRIPLHEITDTENIVAKMIQYEKNPGNGDPSYVGDVSLFDADQMRDYNWKPPYEGQAEIISQAIPDNFNKNLSLREQTKGDDLAPISPSAVDIIDSLSQGYGMIYYMNHGMVNRFDVKTSGYNHFPKQMIGLPSLDNLENYNAPSFVNTLSCDQAMFDGEEESIVEKWLSLENKGAFSLIGYSRWGWVNHSYLLMRSFAEHAFGTGEEEGEEQEPVGVALSNSKTRYYSPRDLVQGLNLYGDPETILYSEIPEQLSQEIVIDGAIANVVISYKGSPVENAIVIFSNINDEYLRAYTDINGEVNVFLSDILSEGDGNLLVTSFKANTIPIQESIVINCVDDGDNDGYLECTDCNDNNPNINPGVGEVCDNGVDDNCNGIIDGADLSCNCIAKGGECHQGTNQYPCPENLPYEYDTPNFWCSGTAICCTNIAPSIE